MAFSCVFSGLLQTFEFSWAMNGEVLRGVAFLMFFFMGKTHGNTLIFCHEKPVKYY